MGYIVLFFMLFEIFHNILNFRNGESDSGGDHAHSKHFKKLDYERDGNIQVAEELVRARKKLLLYYFLNGRN